MQRRQLFKTLSFGGAMLALPRISVAQDRRTLKYVPLTDVTVLDPVWTTAYITRDHAAMVFDTLYGIGADYEPVPQMVAGHVVEDDGKRWTLTLRPGLRFHDGEPVLARDCVASVSRWGKRDAFGQALLAVTDELSATDDRTIVFRLKRPFPMLPRCLGRYGAPYPAIMPERLAKTDPYTQVTEMVGSGPFRFKADERISGALAVYERFTDYRPREDGVPGGTAGPKIVHLDRVEWHVQPDSATAVNALLTGEVDWVNNPSTDLMPLLKRSRHIKVQQLDPLGNIAIIRMNHLHPPFNNPAIRRALLAAVNQEDFMLAMMGEDRALWRTGIGVFAPASPMATDAGMEVVNGSHDLDRAKREIEAAGYKGEPVVAMIPTDSPKLHAIGEVAVDLMRRIGLNIDYQAMDWGTLTQRRAKKEPLDQGGWSVFFTTWAGNDMFDPAGHLSIRGTGDRAWFGWPTSPVLEELRNAWFEAPDLASQRAICERIQRQVFVDVPYIPLGQVFYSTATQASVTGLLPGFPIFWNVQKAA